MTWDSLDRYTAFSMIIALLRSVPLCVERAFKEAAPVSIGQHCSMTTSVEVPQTKRDELRGAMVEDRWA